MSRRRRKLAVECVLTAMLALLLPVVAAWALHLFAAKSDYDPLIRTKTTTGTVGAEATRELVDFEVPEHWPERFAFEQEVGFGASYAHIGCDQLDVGYEHPTTRRPVIYRWRAGWPWHYLETVRIVDDTIFDGPPRDPVYWGNTWRSFSVVQSLPLAPRPFAFLGAVVMYGTLAGIVVFGIRVLKEGRREAQDRCRVCGYELGGVSTCPECGEQSHAALRSIRS